MDAYRIEKMELGFTRLHAPGHTFQLSGWREEYDDLCDSLNSTLAAVEAERDEARAENELLSCDIARTLHILEDGGLDHEEACEKAESELKAHYRGGWDTYTVMKCDLSAALALLHNKGCPSIAAGIAVGNCCEINDRILAQHQNTEGSGAVHLDARPVGAGTGPSTSETCPTCGRGMIPPPMDCAWCAKERMERSHRPEEAQP